MMRVIYLMLSFFMDLKRNSTSSIMVGDINDDASWDLVLVGHSYIFMLCLEEGGAFCFSVCGPFICLPFDPFHVSEFGEIATLQFSKGHDPICTHDSFRYILLHPICPLSSTLETK